MTVYYTLRIDVTWMFPSFQLLIILIKCSKLTCNDNYILDEAVNIHNTTMDEYDSLEHIQVPNSKILDVAESIRPVTQKTSKRIFDSPFHAKERGLETVDSFNGLEGMSANYTENLAAADSSTNYTASDTSQVLNTSTKCEDEPIDQAECNGLEDLARSKDLEDNIVKSSQQSVDDFEICLEEGPTAKTGFDFLDNW